MSDPAAAAVPIGVGFTPFEDRVDVIERVTARAESRDLAFVSVAEAMSLAAPIVLARLAASTHRIGLVSGVLSVWGRTPATLALTAAELQRHSGGRFVLGLGASTQPVTEGFHGERWQAPLERVRQSLVAVRALLQGERLPGVPEGVRPLRLAHPPETPVPIALAAISTPGIRLAGALADQWFPFLIPPTGLDDGRELIAEAAAESARSAVPTVSAAIPVALAADEEHAARIAARWLVTYTTMMGPVYPRVLRSHGYGGAVDALLEANTDPRRPVLPTRATRLADDVLMFGTYDDGPALARRWQAHADALALVAPFDLPLEEIIATIDAVAPQSQPPSPRRPVSTTGERRSPDSGLTAGG